MDSLLNQNLISSKEAGEISGYSTDYLARLARSNKIVGQRIGHAWFIDKVSLESFLKLQEERKSMYARELSKVREREYRAHQSSLRSVPQAVPKKLTHVTGIAEYSIRPVSMRVHLAAVAMAFVVIVGGVFGAQAANNVGGAIGKVAAQAAEGFQESFLASSPRVDGVAESAKIARADTENILALGSGVPSLSLPQSRAQVAAAFSAFTAPETGLARAPSPTPRGAPASAIAAIPSLKDAEHTVLHLPSLAYSAFVALGSAIIDGTHLAINADVSFAYGVVRVAPQSAQATVAVVGNLGNSLEEVSASSPHASVVAQTLALQSIQAAVKFIKNGAYSGSLAIGDDTQSLAQTLSPNTIEDSYLGLLGNTAVALNSLTGAVMLAVDQAVPLSPLDRAALFTYGTIHGGIVSARAEIASLFGSVSSMQTQIAIPVATSTLAMASTTAMTTVATTTSSPLPAVAQIPSSGTVAAPPVYVTQGVDQNYVDQSIASLSAAVNARIADALRPVQNQVVTNETTIQQVNMIQDLNDLTVTNGTFKNSLLDGGNVTHANLVQATTGEFDNLTGGASTLTTLTLNGALTGYGAITGPYFVATSTTATSTFAGLLAVGTSTPFGNGLLTVGTSSPLFYIDNTTGSVGFGTTSPTEAFSVVGDSYFAGGLGVGTATTSPGSLAVANNAYIGGNLTVGGGSTVLGNSSTDSLVINSSIKSSIVPDKNITYDIGSPSFYWNNAYVQNLNANNISAASTSISGTSNNTFTINSDNVSSDQENESIIFFRGNVVPNALLTWNAATSSKRFEFNQPLYINNASGSTTEPTLTLQGVAGQTANILQIASSTGSTVFSIGPNGQLTSSSLSLSSALGLSSGGTATTTFYNGGVVFSDGTKLTQSAAQSNFFWDEVNKRLGIGTTTPGANLNVYASGTGFNADLVHVQTGNQYLAFGANGGSNFSTIRSYNAALGSEPLVLQDNGGNVGIGTTTPWGLLSLNPSGISGPELVVGSSTATSFVVSNGGNVGIGTTTPSYRLGLWGSGAAGFFGISSTTLGDILNVTSSGKVGIGTTSPSTIFSVQNTVSSPQVRVAYDTTRYADLQVDSVGNLDLNASSGNIYENNGDLFVCANGACPSGTPVGAGVAVVQNHLGIGTSTPTDALDIVGNQPVFSLQDSTVFHTAPLTAFTLKQGSDGTATINNQDNASLILGTNNTERIRITGSGFVGIGTTSPTQQLSVANLLYVGAGGATGLGVATSTFQGDIKITGKLDVGTIDPVYTIDGVKYATYGQATVGEKEEADATLDVSSYDPASQLYTDTIKFADLPKGSDLWLFYQITDFGENWDNLVVSLTPTFNGNVFFKKDPVNHALIVESTQPGQVTARFIANRFDWQHWPNIRPDQGTPDQTGFQLSSKD